MLILAPILFAIACPVHAQKDSTLLAQDTSRWIDNLPKDIGITLEGTLHIAPGLSNHHPAYSLSAMAQYQWFSFGFTMTQFNGQYERKVIFPNLFQLDYRYGGLLANFRIWSKKWTEIHTRFGLGRGDILWESQEIKQSLRDKYNYVSTSFMVVSSPLDRIKLLVSFHYLLTSDLDLPALSSDELKGLGYGVGLKLYLVK